ncbi:hypothetical protein [Clostridium akagii]|uniref:hypothetical protein n=1 Tax=Clostridium akagii TaxID=91623 RepID=UPI00047D7BDB|nr:hypothetical protein [Clostridium akagii]
MANLIKYEIIGRYKSVAMLIIISVLANLLLLIRPFNWPDTGLFVISILIAVVVSVVLFIWSISIFSQDIYDDKGYLTFTLPKSGYSIIASKLIVTCIFYIIIEIISVLSMYYYGSRLGDIGKALDTSGIRINVGACILIILWSVLIGTALNFIKIYFAITITRLSILKKKLGKFMAFVSYVILSIIYGIITWGLEKIFPQDFYIKLFTSVSGSIGTLQSGNTDVITKGFPVNTANFVFSIILCVVLFIATSYLVEKKIDL